MTNDATSVHRTTRPPWWFWAALAVCWYSLISVRPLLEPDEGRYAEIPREMWTSGDWVTPRLSGLKYFEKPPLQYWATAAVYSGFGVSEFTSRVFSATMAFLCLPLVYLFAVRMFGSTTIGSTAVLLLATNPVFVVIGQINLLDSAFAFFISATVFSLLLACSARRGSAPERNWAMLMWTALALAMLTKGVAAVVLTGLGLIAYSIATRDLEPWRRLHWPSGLLLFSVIGAPWFVLVTRRNPEFLQFFFVHEHLARFFTSIHARTGPSWYFVPFLVLAMLPWFKSFAPALRDATTRAPHGPNPRTNRVLWIWCAVVTVFFSISQSKLVPYILPVMPALAVALAQRVTADPLRFRKAAYWLVALVACAAIAVLIEPLRSGAKIPANAISPAVAAVIVAMVAAVAMTRIRLTENIQRFGPAIAAASVLTWSLLLVSYSYAKPTRTAKALVASVRDHVGPTTQVFSVGQYRQTIAPYLGRTLHVVGYSGELAFGQSQQRSTRESGLETFLQQWPERSDAIAFIDPQLYRKLGAARLPGAVLASDDASIVLQR